MATIRYYTEKYIQAIADAIRTKNGKTRKYKTREMGPAIMEMVTYLAHLKTMGSFWINYLQTNPGADPTFTLDDIQSGFAVFDGSGHLTCPAKSSANPGLWLRIKSVDGGWEIYPAIHADTYAIAYPNDLLTVYPMTHSNDVPYSLLENGGLSKDYNWRWIQPELSDTVFSKGSTYIWNITESTTHPALIDRLDNTHSGVISFNNFSRDFTFGDLIDIPDYLNGEVTGIFGYHWPALSSNWSGTITSFHFQTNGEKLYYDLSDNRLKCTLVSYNSPSSYPNGLDSSEVQRDTDVRIVLHKTKLSVSATAVTSTFNVQCASADVHTIIPFRTYDIKDSNGTTIAAKNCDIEDFGIEPKEE